MSEPEGPRADSPDEPPTWGKPPAGGWGAPASDDDERTQRVDPRAFQGGGAESGSSSGRPDDAAKDDGDRTQVVSRGAHTPGAGSPPAYGSGQPGHGGPSYGQQPPPYGAAQQSPAGWNPPPAAPGWGAPGQQAQPGPQQGWPQQPPRARPDQQPGYPPQEYGAGQGAPEYGAPEYGAPEYGAPHYGGQNQGQNQGGQNQGGQNQGGQNYGGPNQGGQNYGGPGPGYGQQGGQAYGGQPAYGAPAYGQAAPGYAQPGYGGPEFGGGPDYGSPEYGTAQDQRPANYPALPDAPAATGTKKSKLPLILGALLALIAIAVGVLGFWKPGFFVTKVFDTTALQSGVTKILTQDYGLQGVNGVSCGQNVKVTQGATFNCSATVDNKQVTVPVRVTSNAGDYEVGRPT